MTIYSVQHELETRKAALVEALATGAANDFADYKRIVGEIRGLSLSINLIADLAQKLEHSDD